MQKDINATKSPRRLKSVTKQQSWAPWQSLVLVLVGWGATVAYGLLDRTPWGRQHGCRSI